MILGWLGNVFILAGILAVAYKYRYGFIAGCIGNALWCIKGAMTSQYDLITIEVIIVALQAFSFYKWSSDDRPVGDVRPGTATGK